MSFSIGISFGREALLVADSRICDLRDDGTFRPAGDRQRKARILRGGAFMMGGFAGDELGPLLVPRAGDVRELKSAAAAVRRKLQRRGMLERLAAEGLLTATVAVQGPHEVTIRMLDLLTGDGQELETGTPMLVRPIEVTNAETARWVRAVCGAMAQAPTVFGVLRVAAAEVLRLRRRHGPNCSVGPDLAGLVLRAGAAGAWEFGATPAQALAEASAATLEAALRPVRFYTRFTCGPRVPSAPLPTEVVA